MDQTVISYDADTASALRNTKGRTHLRRHVSPAPSRTSVLACACATVVE
jgi:hypothetical protein